VWPPDEILSIMIFPLFMVEDLMCEESIRFPLVLESIYFDRAPPLFEPMEAVVLKEDWFMLRDLVTEDPLPKPEIRLVFQLC
jgi:hypothetical protein